MTRLAPGCVEDLAEIVAGACADASPLEIVGGGSKRTLGRAGPPPTRLDLRAFSGIVDYDPAELLLVARAATPLHEIVSRLDAQRQMLAFEPPDWRDLLGADPTASPTLGGTVACNLSGPRRVRAGAARDHLLGFAAVNGRGDVWKAGGRVVKNVTGYDMGKLQAGAYGTLSVLTDINLRVVPKPELARSLVWLGLSEAEASLRMTEALNSPHEVSAAAHLPAACAARASSAVSFGGPATVLRVEGPESSVRYRLRQLGAAGGAPMRLLDAEDSARLWREIADVAPLLPRGGNQGGSPGGDLVWRLCTTPSEAWRLRATLQRELDRTEAFYDWGGGLLWLSLDAGQAGPDGGSARIDAALAGCGGHATLVRAPEALRARTAVFRPMADPVLAMNRRVKSAFDPGGILNPGRMHRGI